MVLISPLLYSKAILKGEAKPHRTTWFVFLLITTLTTASLLASGDTVAVWLAGATTLQSALVFILSIKYGMGGWSKIDIACLLIALLGIYLWKTTANPALALYTSIFADFVGLVPTLIKIYFHPDTEIFALYSLDALAGGLSLLALNSWMPKDYAYPVYIMTINLLTCLLLVISRGGVRFSGKKH